MNAASNSIELAPPVLHGPPPGKGRAIALLLHGYGHNEEMAWKMLGPAMPADVSVLAFRAPFPGPGDASGRGWFTLHPAEGGPPRPDLEQEMKSRAGVIAAAERLRADAPSGHPLLVTGFSQGGMIALNAFLQRPDLFDGCVMATGRLLGSVADDNPPRPAHKGKPVFWCHGKADPIIPVAAAEAGIARLTPYGCDVHAMFHEGGHEVPADAIGDLRQWIEARC